MAQAAKSAMLNGCLVGEPATNLARFSPEINLPATFPVRSINTLSSFEVEPTRAKGACTDNACEPLLYLQ